MDKHKIIERLWHKHSYQDMQGIKSDRDKIIIDYKKETGEDISKSTLGNYIRKIDKGESDSEGFIRHTEDGSGNITSVIRKRMSNRRVFSNQELMELHAINPKENKIKQIVSNEWSMTNKDGDQFYNFQSKIIAVPLGVQEMTMEEFIEAVRVEPKPLKIETMGIGKRHLLVGLADLHFGHMTIEQLKPELAEVMGIMENGYDSIVIEQTGDLFESSQMKEAITLKGTMLASVDMVKAVADAKQFYYTLIEHAVKYCNKVVIEHACGNHSGNMEYMFMEGVRERYKLMEYSTVTVNNHNDYRTAFRIGDVGIMLSHGDTVPLARLPLKFAAEYPLLWGDVEHREVHTGHKHSSFKETDVDGVTIRQFPTPKTNGIYEDRMGYNSRKFIQLIEYNDSVSKSTYEIDGIE